MGEEPQQHKATGRGLQGAVPDLIPLRLLGLAFVFIWDWCLVDPATNVVAAGVEEVERSLTSVFSIVYVVALVGFALGSRRIGSIASRPALPIGAGLGGAAGAVLSLCVTNGLLPAGVASVAAGVALGCSSAILVLSWAELYSRLEAGRVFLFGSLSLVVAGIVYFFIVQSGPAVRIGSTVAAPLVSLAMWALSAGYLRPKDSEIHAVRYKFPWKPVTIMGVCTFAAAFIDMTLFMIGRIAVEGQGMAALAHGAVGVALVVLTVTSRLRIRPLFLVGASFTCLTAGIVAVVLAGGIAAQASALLVQVSTVLMEFFTFALLANICYRHEVSSLWLFGLTVAVQTLSRHLGGIAYRLVPDLSSTMGDAVNLMLMAVVALIAIGVVAMVWMSERSFNSSWAVERVDVKKGDRIVTERERLLGMCEAAAAEHGLTERERDILEMTVAGMRYPEMSQSLLLSPNTIKTHKRHMYAKLGVHSREEVLELLRGTG